MLATARPSCLDMPADRRAAFFTHARDAILALVLAMGLCAGVYLSVRVLYKLVGRFCTDRFFQKLYPKLCT